MANAIRYFTLRTKRNFVRSANSVTAFHFCVLCVLCGLKISLAADTAAIQQVGRTFHVLCFRRLPPQSVLTTGRLFRFAPGSPTVYFFPFISSRRFLIISSAMVVGTSLYLEKFIVNVPCPLVAPRRSLA